MDISNGAGSRPTIDTHTAATAAVQNAEAVAVGPDPHAPMLRSSVHDYPRPSAAQLRSWQGIARTQPGTLPQAQHRLLQAIKVLFVTMVQQLDQAAEDLDFSPPLRQAWKAHLRETCAGMLALTPRRNQVTTEVRQAQRQAAQKLVEQIDDMRDLSQAMNTQAAQTIGHGAAALKNALDNLMAAAIAMHGFLQIAQHAPRPLLRPEAAPALHARQKPPRA